MNVQERKTAIESAKAKAVDMKLEVVVIPVSDVDRAKAFYTNLGWRLDADFAAGDDWRVIQFTPPGSPASVIFGKNVTSAAPGSAQGLYLVVADIEAARADLRARAALMSARRFIPPAASTSARTSPSCSVRTG
jgi:catechol 2,3-dioxygenase-like lactoylglutathione lyase family enzyme